MGQSSRHLDMELLVPEMIVEPLSTDLYSISWTSVDANQTQHQTFCINEHDSSYEVIVHPGSAVKGDGLELRIRPHDWLPPSKLPSAVIAFKDNNIAAMPESSIGIWGPIFWKPACGSGLGQASVVSQAPFAYSWNNPGYHHVQQHHVASSAACKTSFRLILFFGLRFDPRQEMILSHLNQMFERQSLTDVHFTVGGQKMGAHLVIVTSASPVLAAMFENDFVERQTKSIEINDAEPDIFMEMLRFMYTGQVSKLEHMAEQLLSVADKYQVDLLKKTCEEKMCNHLTLDNAIRYLILAHKHSATKLHETALKFIVVHKRQVVLLAEWKQLMDAWPDLFLKAVERMVTT